MSKLKTKTSRKCTFLGGGRGFLSWLWCPVSQHFFSSQQLWASTDQTGFCLSVCSWGGVLDCTWSKSGQWNFSRSCKCQVLHIDQRAVPENFSDPRDLPFSANLGFFGGQNQPKCHRNPIYTSVRNTSGKYFSRREGDPWELGWYFSTKIWMWTPQNQKCLYSQRCADRSPRCALCLYEIHQDSHSRTRTHGLQPVRQLPRRYSPWRYTPTTAACCRPSCPPHTKSHFWSFLTTFFQKKLVFCASQFFGPAQFSHTVPALFQWSPPGWSHASAQRFTGFRQPPGSRCQLAGPPSQESSERRFPASTISQPNLAPAPGCLRKLLTGIFFPLGGFAQSHKVQLCF